MLMFSWAKIFSEEGKKWFNMKPRNLSKNTRIFIWIGENITLNLGMMFIFLKKKTNIFFTCSIKKKKTLKAMNTWRQWTLLVPRLWFKNIYFPVKGTKTPQKTADSRLEAGNVQDVLWAYCCAGKQGNYQKNWVVSSEHRSKPEGGPLGQRWESSSIE